MITWKDTTSYSRDDKEKIPGVFSTRAGDLHISVVRSHIYYKGRWILQCEPFYREYELKGIDAADIEGAQARAIELVRAKVAEVVAGLDA